MTRRLLESENPMWKGNDVGYFSLHQWVKSRKEKPLFCEQCGVKPPLDLANKSGNYMRDLNDWEWLCRSCHMTIDGRLSKIHSGLPERNKKRALNCQRIVTNGVITYQPKQSCMAELEEVKYG